mmetsp:Transcript_16694/g.63466  ORF Transcript_16694/g.63466 Transcript_16694/m.63466 type:complete len:89 (+) Transcript_16694:1828-2094(+)
MARLAQTEASPASAEARVEGRPGDSRWTSERPKSAAGERKSDAAADRRREGRRNWSAPGKNSSRLDASPPETPEKSSKRRFGWLKSRS